MEAVFLLTQSQVRDRQVIAQQLVEGGIEDDTVVLTDGANLLQLLHRAGAVACLQQILSQHFTSLDFVTQAGIVGEVFPQMAGALGGLIGISCPILLAEDSIEQRSHLFCAGRLIRRVFRRPGFGGEGERQSGECKKQCKETRRIHHNTLKRQGSDCH